MKSSNYLKIKYEQYILTILYIPNIQDFEFNDPMLILSYSKLFVNVFVLLIFYDY